MTEEEKQENLEQASDDATQETATPKKTGLLTYIIIGVGGLAVIGLVTVSVLLFLGKDKGEPEAAESGDVVAITVTDKKTEPANMGNKVTHQTPEGEIERHGSDELNTEDESEISYEDSILALIEEESGVIDDIMKNLDFLDYKPSANDLGDTDADVSLAEDSIAQVNWLESEKTRLTAWEKELNTRQRELDITEKKVSQKLLKLEQAESTKTSNLAKLYDGMDARSVAKLMANLDDDTVVAILPRMKLKNASQVLALMPAKRAAKLSKQMITIAEN